MATGVPETHVGQLLDALLRDVRFLRQSACTPTA